MLFLVAVEAGGGSSNSPDNSVRDGTGGGSCGGVGSKNGLSPLSGPAILTHPNNPTIAALAGVTFNHYGNVGGTGDDSTVGEGSGGGGAGGGWNGCKFSKEHRLTIILAGRAEQIHMHTDQQVQ